MEVYLDNSATTKAFPEVAELVAKIMCEDYGNPSSLHLKGVQAERYIRYAKETNNYSLLLFLQHNADVAYGHRNENGLIWTDWHIKTPTDPVAEKHNAFSMSTAVSLLYNCQAWW